MSFGPPGDSIHACCEEVHQGVSEATWSSEKDSVAAWLRDDVFLRCHIVAATAAAVGVRLEAGWESGPRPMRSHVGHSLVISPNLFVRALKSGSLRKAVSKALVS